MNSKKLLIAFTAVSIAALIVSSFAVFAVAKTYSASLARNVTEGEAEEISPPEISASLPAESGFDETTDTAAESETVTLTEDISEPTATESETVLADVTAEETTAEVTGNIGFTLSLSESRLVIRGADGGTVYERIIDESDLRQNDRNALIEGIGFPELADAMSAIYDLIS